MSEDDIEMNTDAAVEAEVEVSNVDAFINALQADDMVAAQDAFSAEMSNRIGDALDAHKIDIAANMYGSSDEVTTDVEPEEMELDIEDEELEVSED